jgi:hypothetical protein
MVVPNFRWKNFSPSGSIGQKVGAVFQDGGQGINSCTLENSLMEVLAKWKDEKVVIVSIGCGDVNQYNPISKARKMRTIRQIGSYLGQARAEATQDQVLSGYYVDQMNPNVRVFRLNVELPNKLDKLDGVKHIKEYLDYGEKLVTKVNPDMIKLLKEGF